MCNNKTKFYQEKLEHFEKHLEDYVNIIFALRRRNSLESSALKVYKKYVIQIKSSISSFSKLKHGLVARLRMCQKNGARSWSTTQKYYTGKHERLFNFVEKIYAEFQKLRCVFKW